MIEVAWRTLVPVPSILQLIGASLGCLSDHVTREKLTRRRNATDAFIPAANGPSSSGSTPTEVAAYYHVVLTCRVLFQFSIRSSNGPLNVLKVMACVMVICSSRSDM